MSARLTVDKPPAVAEEPKRKNRQNLFWLSAATTSRCRHRHAQAIQHRLRYRRRRVIIDEVKIELPIIDSCDNCGACCMEQESPPGYAMLLSSPEMMEQAGLYDEDVQRLRSLPPAALEELQEYVRRIRAGVERSTRACIWLDQTTMRCRYYQYRPMICRAFEVGSDECLDWRIAYAVDQ